MAAFARVFVPCAWAGWLLYWLIAALRTKRTIERRGFFGYRAVTVALAVGLIALLRAAGVRPQSHLWNTTAAVGLVAVLLVLAGLAFTVWARVALGGNWSAEVTFKQDHELIETGPYALVRHPIYTGLITMGLGTALQYGRPLGFALFVALCGGLWWKARQEEAIMSQHFPGYAGYRARVRAILPFLL